MWVGVYSYEFMNALIRKIKKDDYRGVSNMMHELCQMHAIKNEYFYGPLLKKYDALNYVRSNLRNKNRQILVAEIGQDLVGYAFISIEKAEDYFRFKKYLYLDEIFVRRGYRNKGIGGRLMNVVIKISKDKKAPILARIYPFNKNMRKFIGRLDGKLLYGTYVMSDKSARSKRTD